MHVIKARGLRKADRFGHSDPWCLVRWALDDDGDGTCCTQHTSSSRASWGCCALALATTTPPPPKIPQTQTTQTVHSFSFVFVFFSHTIIPTGEFDADDARAWPAAARTETIADTEDPTWRERCTFLLPLSGKQKRAGVRVELFDEDAPGAESFGECLGQCRVGRY